jgi:hypothetical protein
MDHLERLRAAPVCGQVGLAAPGWRSCCSGRRRGCVLDVYGRVSFEKGVCVDILDFLSGLATSAGDKRFRAETGGFAGVGREWTWELSGRCNKMLLRPRTDLGLLFFEGEREADCRDGSSKGPWSMLGMQ